MRIEPFGERIAIRVLSEEETTASGLIMASSKSSSNRGEVTAVSEEVKNSFKLGDKVIFNRGTGTPYTDGSEEYRIISINDVLCKLIEE